MLVAWARPGASEVWVGLGSGRRWESIASVAAPGVVGAPSVVKLATGWAVAWNAAVDGVDGVQLATFDEAVTRHATFEIGDGQLLGAATIEDSVALVVADGAWLAVATLRLSRVTPIPIPIDVSRDSVVRLDDAALESVRIEWAGSAGQWPFVAWSVAPHALDFVELAAAGPILPSDRVVHPGSPKGRAALVQRASRAVSDRHR